MAAQHRGAHGMHLTSSPLDWYAARAGGVVAYVLLSTAVVFGLAMSGKQYLKRWPRFAIEDVHRFLGIMTGTFIVIHIAAIAIDAYLPFSLAALLIPLVSKYRAVWVALGIVAAELLVALAVANHYRDRGLAYKAWRKTHYLNFVVWTAATLHGLGSGTDRSAGWLLAVYVVAIASVVGLTAWRVLRLHWPSRWALRLAPPVAACLSVMIVGSIALATLRFQPKPWNAARFTDVLHGQILSDNGVTRGIISMAGNGIGTQRVLLRADLLITPQELLSTSFQMEYLPSGLLCRGRVTQVHSHGFEATCRPPNGAQRKVTAEWQPSEGPELQGGVLKVTTS
jgi:sulfoxide reductase heme-binding subunit YedZ